MFHDLCSSIDELDFACDVISIMIDCDEDCLECCVGFMVSVRDVFGCKKAS